MSIFFWYIFAFFSTLLPFLFHLLSLLCSFASKFESIPLAFVFFLFFFRIVTNTLPIQIFGNRFSLISLNLLHFACPHVNQLANETKKKKKESSNIINFNQSQSVLDFDCVRRLRDSNERCFVDFSSKQGRLFHFASYDFRTVDQVFKS